MKMFEFLTVLVVNFLSFISRVFPTQSTPTDISSSLSEILSIAFSNPKVLIVMLIQLTHGLGLGYISFKALKYALALIAILALGSILSLYGA